MAPRPAVDSDDAARREAREVLALLGKAGWCRHAVPRAFDGASAAVDLVHCCLIREALAAASPLADAVFALQCLGAMPLVLAAERDDDAAAAGRWLPAIAAGEAMAGFAMTEANAGSDVQGMATRAERTADGWRLAGEKSLISNAGIADVYVVFARSGEDGEGRPELSAFVVPARTPGVELAEAQVLSEPHPLGRLAFDCELPAAALLGEAGGGFALGMATLDRLRTSVAAAACGMAARALAEATAWARDRQQFGRPLARFQLVQAKLATMATELAGARLLTYRAAWEARRGGGELQLRSAMAKYAATEAAQRVVDQAVQILGGRGVLAQSPVDRLYRAVRALRIYEGTSEIQQLIIARHLLARDSVA